MFQDSKYKVPGACYPCKFNFYTDVKKLDVKKVVWVLRIVKLKILALRHSKNKKDKTK